jgi:TetR/AcrR family transcriptional repressor of lmrAB and yxaGH operons
VAESGRKAYAARIDVLKRKLTSDGFSPASTGRLAILCVSALQGALIQARVERSGAPIEIAAEELAKMLENVRLRPS